jgi:hypothetical protein
MECKPCVSTHRRFFAWQDEAAKALAAPQDGAPGAPANSMYGGERALTRWQRASSVHPHQLRRAMLPPWPGHAQTRHRLGGAGAAGGSGGVYGGAAPTINVNIGYGGTVNNTTTSGAYGGYGSTAAASGAAGVACLLPLASRMETGAFALQPGASMLADAGGPSPRRGRTVPPSLRSASPWRCGCRRRCPRARRGDVQLRPGGDRAHGWTQQQEPRPLVPEVLQAPGKHRTCR